jgi:serine/threonine protein kinase
MKYNHPNIVQVVETFDMHAGHIKLHCIVMEYCNGGDLYNFIENHGGKKEHLKLYTSLMKDMLKALHEVHGQGECHRDVKPLNIFLKRGRSNQKMDLFAILGDFGHAKEGKKAEESKFSYDKGTILYWSPERHDYAPYGPPADVFGLGMIFFEMLTK